MADALATLAAVFGLGKVAQIQSVIMQTFEAPAHCYNIEEEHDGNPWYHDILQFIRHQVYPKEASDNDKKDYQENGLRICL